MNLNSVCTKKRNKCNNDVISSIQVEGTLVCRERKMIWWLEKLHRSSAELNWNLKQQDTLEQFPSAHIYTGAFIMVHVTFWYDDTERESAKEEVRERRHCLPNKILRVGLFVFNFLIEILRENLDLISAH
jgi:hypothetical protein